MGEEYAEDAPFQFFVSFGDPELVEAVRRGRREEFADFDWSGHPPDPQNLQTFEASRLRWDKREKGRHLVMLDFYRELIALRREVPALAALDKESLEVDFGKDPSGFACIDTGPVPRRSACSTSIGKRSKSTPCPAAAGSSASTRPKPAGWGPAPPCPNIPAGGRSSSRP